MCLQQLEEEKVGKNMGQLGRQVAACLVLVALVSDNFCNNPFTSSIYQFVKVEQSIVLGRGNQ